MAIIAKGGGRGAFTPCPTGMHRAVCCDVVDHGLLETDWGPKHKIDIKFQTDAPMENGQPFLVQKRYTLSLHEKANLTADLQSWRGRIFSLEELAQGIDLEQLIGVNCQLVVVHKESNGPTPFANISAITPAASGTKKLTVTDYTREKDRHDEAPRATIPEGVRSSQSQPAPPDLAGDDIPF